MEEENHLHRNNLRRIHVLLSTKRVLNSTSAFVLLFVSAYAFGFFTSHSIKWLATDNTGPKENRLSPSPLAPELDLYRFNSACAEPVPSKLVRQTILDRVFNGSSPFDGFPPPHALAFLRPRRVKGWGSTGAVFEALIRKVQPRTIVELGSFLGASAIHMAGLTQRLGLKTQILCVDDFRGWPGFRDKFRDIKMVNGDVALMYQFMQNVAQSNLTDWILPIPFSTGSALSKLCEWGVHADLVEVDAGHDFHSAWADINRAYSILRPGGIIFGHDYFTSADHRGVRRAVNLFAQVKGLRVQPNGEHWVLAPV